MVTKNESDAEKVCEYGGNWRVEVPEISRFFGIVIAIYWQEHGIPHFHAKYGGHRASFAIEDLRLLEGKFPPRAMALVVEWAVIHRAELMNDWHLAMSKKPLNPIQPLD